MVLFKKKQIIILKSLKIEGKIPFAKKTPLTAVENEIPSVSSLVKKTDYNTIITEIESKLNNHDHDKHITIITEIESKLNNHDHDKYITTPEFNNLAADVFNARLARVNLVVKTYFDNSVSILDNKIAANKTKNESIENEIKKPKYT